MPTSEGALGQFIGAWPGQPWSRDDRFRAFASTLDSGDEAKAVAALALVCPDRWTHETLNDAPADLARICAATGGLRKGQLFFTGTAFSDVMLYALWWPWSGGKTITLRLGAADADAPTLARLAATLNVGA